MKKVRNILVAIMIIAASTQTQAQAFDQSTKMLTISIGGADMFHFPQAYSWVAGYYTPLTGQFYLQGEFAVHKYVGVGFDVTLGGRPGDVGVFGAGYTYAYTGYRSEFNVAAGGFANFHFFQLIADKTGKNLHADKLDIYAGLTLGGGAAIHPSDAYYSTTNLDAILIAGPQVGVHYFFTDHIAINGEVGFSKTFVSGGITFKLGGKSSKGK